MQCQQASILFRSGSCYTRSEDSRIQQIRALRESIKESSFSNTPIQLLVFPCFSYSSPFNTQARALARRPLYLHACRLLHWFRSRVGTTMMLGEPCMYTIDSFFVDDSDVSCLTIVTDPLISWAASITDHTTSTNNKAHVQYHHGKASTMW